jgi:hypothetical protein
MKSPEACASAGCRSSGLAALSRCTGQAASVGRARISRCKPCGNAENNALKIPEAWTRRTRFDKILYHKIFREDAKMRHEGDKRRGAIGPVVVVERGGKFSVLLESHHLKLSWNDLEEKSVDPALNAAWLLTH